MQYLTRPTDLSITKGESSLPKKLRPLNQLRESSCARIILPTLSCLPDALQNAKGLPGNSWSTRFTGTGDVKCLNLMLRKPISDPGDVQNLLNVDGEDRLLVLVS